MLCAMAGIPSLNEFWQQQENEGCSNRAGTPPWTLDFLLWGNMVATSQMRQFESEFQFQFIEIKDNYKFSSSDTLATYKCSTATCG